MKEDYVSQLVNWLYMRAKVGDTLAVCLLLYIIGDFSAEQYKEIREIEKPLSAKQGRLATIVHKGIMCSGIDEGEFLVARALADYVVLRTAKDFRAVLFCRKLGALIKENNK